MWPLQLRESEGSEVWPLQLRESESSEVWPLQLRESEGSEVWPLQLREVLLFIPFVEEFVDGMGILPQQRLVAFSTDAQSI